MSEDPLMGLSVPLKRVACPNIPKELQQILKGLGESASKRGDQEGAVAAANGMLLLGALMLGRDAYFYEPVPLKVTPWCKTMNRPKSECGCPDCGSSLIQVGEGGV